MAGYYHPPPGGVPNGDSRSFSSAYPNMPPPPQAVPSDGNRPFGAPPPGSWNPAFAYNGGPLERHSGNAQSNLYPFNVYGGEFSQSGPEDANRRAFSNNQTYAFPGPSGLTASSGNLRPPVVENKAISEDGELPESDVQHRENNSRMLYRDDARDPYASDEDEAYDPSKIFARESNTRADRRSSYRGDGRASTFGHSQFRPNNDAPRSMETEGHRKEYPHGARKDSNTRSHIPPASKPSAEYNPRAPILGESVQAQSRGEDSSYAPTMKSVPEARKEAQNAILNLMPAKVRFQDYLDEGLDESIVRSLFEDIGMPPPKVGSQPTRSTNKVAASADRRHTNTEQEADLAPTNPAVPSFQVLLPAASKTKEQSKPSSVSKPSTASVPPKTMAPKVSDGAAGEERKDRIARLMAEKVQGKAEAQIAKEEKAKILQEKIDALQRSRVSRANQAAGATKPASAPVKVDTANNSAKSQSSSLPQSPLVPSGAQGATSQKVIPAAAPPVQATPSIPGLFLATATPVSSANSSSAVFGQPSLAKSPKPAPSQVQPSLPQMPSVPQHTPTPPQFGRQSAFGPQTPSLPQPSNASVPGLPSLTGSGTNTPPRTYAAGGLSSFQSPGPGSRKRPVASDFDEPSSLSVKRPFGQSRTEHSLVIDVSDDDESTDGDAAMDVDHDVSSGSRTAVNRSTSQIVGSFGHMPSLSEVPPRNLPSKPSSAPLTPPTTQNTAKPGFRISEDLLRKERALQQMKQRIAEKEQRLKQSKLPSANQTPTLAHASIPQKESIPPTLVSNNTQAAEQVDRLVNNAEKEINQSKSKPGDHQTKENAQAVDLEESEQRRLRRSTIDAELPALDAEIEEARRRIASLKAKAEAEERELRRKEEEKRRLAEEQTRLRQEEADRQLALEKEKLDELTREEEARASQSGQLEETALPQPANPQNGDNTNAKGLSLDTATEPATSEKNDANDQSLQTSDQVSAHIDSDTKMADSSPKPSISQSETLRPSHEGSEAAIPEATENKDSSRSASVLMSSDQVSPQVPHQDVPDKTPAPTTDVGGVDVEMEDSYDPSSNNLETPPATAAGKETIAERGGLLLEGEETGSANSDVYEPPEATPAVAMPQEATPQEATLQETTPEEARPPTPMPQEAMPQGAMPREAAPPTHMDQADSPPFSPAPPELVSESARADSQAVDTPAVESTNAHAPDVETEAQPSAAPLPVIGESKSIEDSVRPSGFAPYESPLKYFRAYRFHPDFQKEASDGFKSLTYSNRIDHDIELCRFELAGGKCNDEKCEFQHFKNMSLPEEMILVELGNSNGYKEEDRPSFVAGLKSVLQELRSKKTRDFQVIASEIAAYRARFLKDTSRVVLIDGSAV